MQRSLSPGTSPYLDVKLAQLGKEFVSASSINFQFKFCALVRYFSDLSKIWLFFVSVFFVTGEEKKSRKVRFKLWDLENI